ncbi:RluA family pseudouridine synthase [Paragemmobacter straminiformis]|uniref:RluA family pseudouridine synthase n=1 Tax=Paragemmobacter straminiformis TaxID=2045119 RepID=UPI0030CA597A
MSLLPDFSYSPPPGDPVILFEDARIIVVDKPSGLLSVPGKLEGREDCLMTRLELFRPGALLVHRLDCDTSGVMIFARDKAAQGFLGQEFEKRRARKSYIARVAGLMAEDRGTVDLPLCADWEYRPRQKVDHERGRPAVTDWEVVSRSNGETRVRMFPHTGRSHQLRVHMRELGHAILGDPIYAEGSARDYPRLMLHAETLALHHPETKAWVEFSAACPF